MHISRTLVLAFVEASLSNANGTFCVSGRRLFMRTPRTWRNAMECIFIVAHSSSSCQNGHQFFLVVFRYAASMRRASGFEIATSYSTWSLAIVISSLVSVNLFFMSCSPMNRNEEDGTMMVSVTRHQ